MSFIIAGAAIGAVGAGANIIGGANKTAAGNKLARGNIRPMYSIPQEYEQNVDLAGSQAENGLPESTVNFFNTQNNRGLSTGVDAILQGGGDVNNLSKLYDSFTQGLGSESAEDAQMKAGHINTFINANKDLAGQKTQQWALNEYDPFKDTAQEAQALKNAGSSEVQTGIGEAVATAGTLANQELYKGQSPVKTMGQKKGIAPLSLGAPSINLPTASGGDGTIPAYSVPGAQAFASPGGNAVLGSVAKTDANSTQLQQLINILNQGQVAA